MKTTRSNLLRALAALLLPAAILLTFLSCSAPARMSEYDRSGSAYAPGYDDYAENAAPTEKGDAGAPTTIRSSAEGQKLIKTVEMALETTEFDAFTEKMNEALLQTGGYVENANVRKNSYSSLRSGAFTLRVPAEKLTQFTEALKEGGNLLYSSESAVDVSLTYADLEGRLSSLRAEQTALNEMLKKAEIISDIIEIQSRLTSVRGEIESLESQLRVLSSRIDYSTVSISVSEVEKVTVSEKELTVWEELAQRFSERSEALGDYLRSMFVGIVGGLPTFLGVLITAAVILLPPAILVLVIVLIVRSSRKRKAAKAAKAAASAPENAPENRPERKKE